MISTRTSRQMEPLPQNMTLSLKCTYQTYSCPQRWVLFIQPSNVEENNSFPYAQRDCYKISNKKKNNGKRLLMTVAQWKSLFFLAPQHVDFFFFYIIKCSVAHGFMDVEI